MTAPALPADRAMTAEELRGFRIACACMVSWGKQLVAASVSTGGPPQPIPMVRLQEARARFLIDVGTALDLTIGQGRPRRPVRPLGLPAPRKA